MKEHRWLNVIRTSRFPFALLRFLSRCGGVFRRGRAGEPAAFASFEANNGGRPINGQGLPPVAELPFGRYPMSYNGCEVIAAYNVLSLLGKRVPLGALAERFARRGMLLGGLFGTDPGALVTLLREQGWQVRLWKGKEARQFDKALASADAAVFSYWTGRTLRRGNGRWHTVHTVAVAREEGNIALYNESSRAPRPNRSHDSLDEFIRERDVLPLLLITVKCSSPVKETAAKA